MLLQTFDVCFSGGRSESEKPLEGLRAKKLGTEGEESALKNIDTRQQMLLFLDTYQDAGRSLQIHNVGDTIHFVIIQVLQQRCRQRRCLLPRCSKCLSRGITDLLAQRRSLSEYSGLHQKDGHA